MNLKHLLAFVTILLLCPTVQAVQVNENVIFKTSTSSADYHMADNYNFTNVTIYPTALNINSGNITTYPQSGWINMSLSGLTTSRITFMNNVSAANISITDNFANFTLSSGRPYVIRYANGTGYQIDISSSSIDLDNIPAGSWYIEPISTIFGTGAVSPAVIKDHQSSIVTMTLTDYGSNISTVYVKIEGTNYTMTSLGGGSYTYTYSNTAIVKKHYISNFYAQDDEGNWNSTTSSLYIQVLAAPGEGGGGVPPYPPAATPTPGPVGTPKPIIQDIEKTVSNITKTIFRIDSYDQLRSIRFNFELGQAQFTKQIYRAGITGCEYAANSAVTYCDVDSGTITVTVTLEPKGVYNQFDEDFMMVNRTGHKQHIGYDIIVINFMGYISTPAVKIGTVPAVLFATDQSGSVIGVRLWWLTLIGIGLIWYAWRKNVKK